MLGVGGARWVGERGGPRCHYIISYYDVILYMYKLYIEYNIILCSNIYIYGRWNN